MLFERKAAEVAIERVLSGARATQGDGLLFRGEQGSGKTTLLDLASSSAADMTVLRCSGSLMEKQIPYSALHQLLRPLLGMVDELPEQQSAALQSALGFVGSHEANRFGVPLAVLDLLSECAQRRPLLLLVDDVQAIDHGTASVLAFVAQRLRNERVALIMTAEVVVDYAFAVHGISTFDLPPLTNAGIAGILFHRTGERPSLHVVEEVLAASLGNPKAATMLASSLAADEVAGRLPLPTPLPISAGHEAPLLARLRDLPLATRTLLLIAALEESGDSMKLFAAAQRLGLSVISALEPAEANGLIDVAGISVTFREPLMREAIKRAASFRDRRSVHLALANLLETDGEREISLWHRAQATLGSDEQLARELEGSASLLRRTYGCSLAVKVLQRAADLSEDAGRRAFRSMLASEVTLLAGQVGRSLSLADSAFSNPSASVTVRMRALATRGKALLSQGNAVGAIEALSQAADEAQQTDATLAIATGVAASGGAFVIGDLPRSARLLRRVSGLPPGIEERAPYEFGFVLGFGSMVAHDAAARVAALGEAAATAADRSDIMSLARAARIASTYGDERSAFRFSERALRQAREEGALGIMPELLMNVAMMNRSAERSAVIEVDALEALRLAEEMGQDGIVLHASCFLTWIVGRQGRLEEAQEHAARGSRLAQAFGYPFYLSCLKWTQSILDMGAGNYELAYGKLANLQTDLPETHPVIALWSIPDLVDAAVRSRTDLSFAESMFARYDAWAEKNRSYFVLAMREHCRGMLFDGPHALKSFELALKHHGDDQTFFSAQTHLAYGEVLRRSRRRSDARVHLRVALETFEMMGAAPWANRARSELRASGESGTRVGADDGRLEMLTPQELQIARLVGSGCTNREVAAQLFLSHRTVEYHLHKMFGKLDVTSRSELVRMVMETIELNDVESVSSDQDRLSRGSSRPT